MEREDTFKLKMLFKNKFLMAKKINKIKVNLEAR